MKIIFTLIASIVLTGIGMGQEGFPTLFKLNSVQVGGEATSSLKSNIISEIVLQDSSTVWLGTGKGLAVMHDSLVVSAYDTFTLATDGSQIIMNYGISAISVKEDTILVATAFNADDVSVGGGLFYSTNSQDTNTVWTFFDQPIDQQADTLAPFANRFFRTLPITTDHQNVTYDASIGGGYVWITSWAGGLRRMSLSGGNSWDRVPLPLDGQDTLNTCNDSSYSKNSGGDEILENFYLNPRDPAENGNHNHKSFSVLAYNDTVWVGTASGINRGIIGVDGCIDWEHYYFPKSGLSGNWVVGIDRQDLNGQRVIWAVTLATGSTEKRGLSYTLNDGETWHPALLDERAYNVKVSGESVFAATEAGLWTSVDRQNWALYKPASNATPLQSDEILSDVVYSIAYDNRNYYSQPVIWVGTPDGLGRSLDAYGSDWEIYRTAYTPGKAYAYPNPFSPYSHNVIDGDGYVRIHTDVSESFIVEMKIYNYAMEEVLDQPFDRRLGKGTLKWDGRDKNGTLVANGVYFIKLNYDAKKEWIKLIVIK